jgi:hypothetical protein
LPLPQPPQLRQKQRKLASANRTDSKRQKLALAGILQLPVIGKGESRPAVCCELHEGKWQRTKGTKHSDSKTSKGKGNAPGIWIWLLNRTPSASATGGCIFVIATQHHAPPPSDLLMCVRMLHVHYTHGTWCHEPRAYSHSPFTKHQARQAPKQTNTNTPLPSTDHATSHYAKSKLRFC